MIVGEPEQRARPWGTVFRIETADGGIVWSKANGPGSAHEGRVLELLRSRGETIALLPLAVDQERGWLLSDDGGPTLRSTTAADGRRGDLDLAVWSRILAVYGAFQRRTASAVGELLAAGVPDERPIRYPALLERFLADDGPWRRADRADRPATEAARDRLLTVLPRVRELADELSASPVAASLDHGDLHGNNVLVTAPRTAGGEIRVFDWGDSVVAHPFATLTTTLGSVGYYGGLDPYGPGLAVVRDAYLSVWADVASLEQLRREATLAMDLGHIGKVAAWERAVTGLEPEEMGGFHGDSAAWLRDLVSRLERR